MRIEIVYFGKPKENLKVSQETVTVPGDALTLSGLLEWLRSRGGDWVREMDEDKVRCAVNQDFAALTRELKENDEVAITAHYHGCAEFWEGDPRLRPLQSSTVMKHCS
uniref:Uncharacterized protein n=1 Tax=Candidatus Nitrotoga fabula TaxID=2182327 RepID=A0A2X0REL4_9PROT|nr:protein of unknown function [Candidatus Nitrotoga fabula]